MTSFDDIDVLKYVLLHSKGHNGTHLSERKFSLNNNSYWVYMHDCCSTVSHPFELKRDNEKGSVQLQIDNIFFWMPYFLNYLNSNFNLLAFFLNLHWLKQNCCEYWYFEW
jgi:hypothetical protein